MSIKKRIKGIITKIKKKEKIPIPVQMNTTELLNNKVVLITGGSGGIGAAIASKVILNGGYAIVAGTNQDKINEVCKKIDDENNNSGKIKGIVINMLDVESMPQKIIEAEGLFEHKIDILVNAAGVMNKDKKLNISAEEFDRVMDVNLKGVYFMCQSMGLYMISNKIKGHILNVSSSSALRPAWTPYQVSKWGIRGMTLGFADMLLPYGITVNSIAPGQVATPMTIRDDETSIDNEYALNGRFAMPDEIANLAIFMISNMGDLIVGDTYYITGGSGVISLHK